MPNLSPLPAPLPQPKLRRRLESNEQAPPNENEIIRTLIAAYDAGITQRRHAPSAYQPSGGWQDALTTRWQPFRDAFETKDVATLAKLFRGFFRNEGISGFWGGQNMFQIFADLHGIPEVERAGLMMEQIEAWRAQLPGASVAELEAPPIGDPWGYDFEGHLLYEPVLEYHYQADYIARLLGHLPAPIIVEIGGGFGGLAYHIFKRAPGAKYIGFDLLENTLLQSYYLAAAFPHAKILTFDAQTSQLDPATIANYDIILMPNFMVPRMEARSADMILNVRSLSEMSAETIAEYHRQVDRIGRLWFFHENIFKPRLDEHFGIPSTRFPQLKNFVGVASSESRWPRYRGLSYYPCAENLFLHRSALE